MSTGVPMPFVKRQFFTSTGAVANGYKLNVYLTGSSTRTPTYTSSDLAGSQNDNPVTLDTAGQATIYLDPAITYKFVLTDAAGAIEWTEDGVPGNIPATVPWTLQKDAIGSTSTDALVLANSTSAANAAQQYSPRVRWSGTGWNATSSASRVCDWIADERAEQQGSGDPYSVLVFSSQVNAGGYTPRLGLKSSGEMTLAATSVLAWGSSALASPDTTIGRKAAKVLVLAGGANTAGACVDVSTDGTLKVRNFANSADGTVAAGAGTYTSTVTGLEFIPTGGGGAGPRISFQSNTLIFNTGTSGLQVSNQANGAALLTLDNAGLLLWNGGTRLNGTITTAQITGSQNNYNPSGLGTATVVYIGGSAAWDITGLSSQENNRVIWLVNTGAFTFTLKESSGSSSAANRFNLPGAVDFSLTSRKSIGLIYVTDHWQQLG